MIDFDLGLISELCGFVYLSPCASGEERQGNLKSKSQRVV